MDKKISELIEETSLGVSDYLPIYRGGSNFKMNLKDIIDSLSSITPTSGKLVKYDGTGGVAGSVVTATSSPNYIELDPLIGITMVNSAGAEIQVGIPAEFVSSTWTFPVNNGSHTFISEEYLSDNSISTQGYKLNTGAYTYNTGSFTLSDSDNGKILIKNNSSSSVITIPSGLVNGFSCQIIQNSTGVVSFSGAPGVTLNSYGGLTQIGGQYGSAAIQYVSQNTYVLAGNLA